MQLKKVKHYIEQFPKYLRSRNADANLYKWESLATFQKNWDLSVENLAQMYDQSLQNSQHSRLWKRSAYFPKQIMLEFIAMESDYVRHAFTDLFDEQKEVEGRIDRFIFYCDQFLEQFKEINPLSIENNHYHNDNYQIVSLYLGFRYPEQYTLYNQEMFQQLLTKLGSLDVPKINDINRFFKVMRTLQKMLVSNEEIVKLNQQRLQDPRLYKGETLLLAHDFMWAIVEGALK